MVQQGMAVCMVCDRPLHISFDYNKKGNPSYRFVCPANPMHLRGFCNKWIIGTALDVESWRFNPAEQKCPVCGENLYGELRKKRNGGEFAYVFCPDMRLHLRLWCHVPDKIKESWWSNEDQVTKDKL
ncbi:MAG: hypothetical protein GY845_25390 [Planctomycetes bacterium]|nr:hypothetical protein [Planctomycetota bacterium]